MKRLAVILLVLSTLLCLSACSCEHEWNEATCLTPKTCIRCEETEGEALGHSYQEADCETPKTCALCGETEGTALGHEWSAATCDTAKTCTRCAEIEGEPLGHTPGEPNEITDPVACTVLREQYCAVCNTLTASETVQLDTLIQNDLFLFTAEEFMERLTQIAEQHSDTFSYEYAPNSAALQVLADSNGKQSIIQFFHNDASSLAADEADTAEIWCVSLISIGESDADFRFYFYMACDPTLDKDAAFETDAMLSAALLNVAESGSGFGYHQQNQLVYETAYIAEGVLGQDYSMNMTNIYASDFR